MDGPDGQKLIPDWDSDESRTEINLIRKALLRKCRCKKSSCGNNKCSCKRVDNLCTTLCSCVGCKNNSDTQTATNENNLTDNDDKEEDKDETDDEGEDVDYNEEDDPDQTEEEFNDNVEELEELDFDIEYLEFQNDLYAMTQKPYVVSADEQDDDQGEASNVGLLV